MANMTEIKKQIEKNKKKIKNKIFNLNNFNRLLFLSFLLLLCAYIANINDMVVKGFKLQELRKEKSSLVEINKDLENKKINYQSYGELSKRVGDLKMVAVSDVDYIEIVSGAVAKK